MLTYVFAIDIDGGCFAGSIQSQDNLFLFPALRQGQLSAIPTGAAVVILFGISIGIPGMGQMDGCPFAVVKGAVGCCGAFSFEELPAVVDGLGFGPCLALELKKG